MGKDLVTDEITVIMPAYNAERLLPATLDSILLQTYKNWHLIVVNDGSTDKTADILDEYSSKYKNIEQSFTLTKLWDLSSIGDMVGRKRRTRRIYIRLSLLT